MQDVIQDAIDLLSKPLQSRDIEDLSNLSYVKSEIARMIPLAKKNLRIKELEADNIEKQSFLRFRKEKAEWKNTDTVDWMKAKARLNKNVKELEIIELEETYLTLYNFYQELADNIVSTRLILKTL